MQYFLADCLQKEIAAILKMTPENVRAFVISGKAVNWTYMEDHNFTNIVNC